MCFIVEYIFFLYQSYITVWDHIMVIPHLQDEIILVILKIFNKYFSSKAVKLNF